MILESVVRVQCVGTPLLLRIELIMVITIILLARRHMSNHDLEGSQPGSCSVGIRSSAAFGAQSSRSVVVVVEVVVVAAAAVAAAAAASAVAVAVLVQQLML